jgi:hypothetical protein
MKSENNKNDTGTRKTEWRRLLAIGLLLLAVMVVFVWLGSGGLSADWRVAGHFLPSMKDGRFLAFFGTAILSLTGIMAIACLLLRRRAARAEKADGQSGNVIIEFAMLIPVILVLSLLMLQSSMLMGGYMTVHYSSYCAARAAIVYVPEDYTDLSGEGWNVVDIYGGSSQKMSRIRDAAIWAVMPVSDATYESESSRADFLSSGLKDLYSAYGKEAPKWVDSFLAKKFAYAEENTTVDLDPPLDGMRFGEHEDLHVTVRHNLYLNVPYAGAILGALDPDGVELANGKYAIRVEVPCTLTNEGGNDEIDIEIFPD